MITTFKTEFESTLNLAMPIRAAHGESFELVAFIRDNGVPVHLGEYSVELLYQDVNNLSDFYSISGVVEPCGTAKFRWEPKDDLGANCYRAYMKAMKRGEVSYPARWEISLYETPDFSASHVIPHPPILDFDNYDLLNAPWVLMDDFNNHIQNTTIHVTQEEKDAWNEVSAKADEEELSAYYEKTGGDISGNVFVDGSLTVEEDFQVNGNTRLGLVSADTIAVDTYIAATNLGRLGNTGFRLNIPAGRNLSDSIARTSDLKIVSDDIVAEMGDYLPLTGGEITGTLFISESTTTPNSVADRFILGDIEQPQGGITFSDGNMVLSDLRGNEVTLDYIVRTRRDITNIDSLIPAAATSANQLADKNFVTDSITQGTAIFRGNYASKAALMSVDWQTADPAAPNYVSNNDYAVVQDDESQNDECWRYLYVTGTGWTPQYMINESPLTQAQLNALNSGATSAIIDSIADKADKTELGDYLPLSGGMMTGGIYLSSGDVVVPNGVVQGSSVQTQNVTLQGRALSIDADEVYEQLFPLKSGTIALTSDITSATSGLASETYVDTSISNAIGDINSILDTINGETI